MKQRAATQEEIEIIAKGMVVKQNHSDKLIGITFNEKIESTKAIKAEVKKIMKDYKNEEDITEEELLEKKEDVFFVVTETPYNYKLIAECYLFEESLKNSKDNIFSFGTDYIILFDNGLVFNVPRDWEFVDEQITEEFMLEVLEKSVTKTILNTRKIMKKKFNI